MSITKQIQDPLTTTNVSEHSNKLPPPIYIKGVLDFLGLCTRLIKLIEVDNCICKPTIDRLKIQRILNIIQNTLPIKIKLNIALISSKKISLSL